MRSLAWLAVLVQLLGSDPVCLADNAARAAELGAPGVDLNFGCPAPTVNRHRGGAVLLRDPALKGVEPPEIVGGRQQQGRCADEPGGGAEAVDHCRLAMLEGARLIID